MSLIEKIVERLMSGARARMLATKIENVKTLINNVKKAQTSISSKLVMLLYSTLNDIFSTKDVYFK